MVGHDNEMRTHIVTQGKGRVLRIFLHTPGCGPATCRMCNPGCPCRSNSPPRTSNGISHNTNNSTNSRFNYHINNCSNDGINNAANKNTDNRAKNCCRMLEI